MAKNAGFSAPLDYFSLGSANKLKLQNSNLNKSSSTKECPNPHGDVAARDVYGIAISPSCDFKVGADLAAADWPSLGTVYTFEGAELPIMLTEISIKTSAGGEPSVTVSGVGVEAAATTGRVFALTVLGALSPKMMAQDGCAAFTLSGEGCVLNSVDTTAKAEGKPVTVTGVPVASDVYGAKVTVGIKVYQHGNVVPQLTAANGWDITSPLTKTNQDEDYISWSATLTKTLAVTEKTA